MMKPKLMGILNITPDSFSDGGKFCAKYDALKHAEFMLKSGADIIDVGGESTRPGADAISIQEEIDRIMPVLEELVTWDVDISVDTTKFKVAKQALELGVDIINDISGLQFDGELATLVAEYNAKLVIMHMRGVPKTMQEDLQAIDILVAIKEFFSHQRELALLKGVKKENIILDPGIGFGKTLEDNINILKGISDLRSMGYPLLVGASRKSMIGMICDVAVNHRLPGSLAVACVAAQRGVDIIRVHDVAETIQALKMIDKIW